LVPVPDSRTTRYRGGSTLSLAAFGSRAR